MGRARLWSLAVLVALAATPAAAGKIGFVKVEEVLKAVQEGKARLRELEEWARPRTEELAQLRQRVTELQQQVAQQRSVASPEAVARLEGEEREARRRLDGATSAWQADLDARQTEVLRQVVPKVNQIVSDYAQANGYDAVFIMKDSTLLYLAPAADLTSTVVTLYEQRFPLQP